MARTGVASACRSLRARHLAELSGREFFDGVVAIDAVTVVIVRTRDR